MKWFEDTSFDTVVTHCIVLSECFGGDYEKATPVPIPNTAVKLLSADDTWLVTARENKSPPNYFKAPRETAWGFAYSATYFPSQH